MARPKNKEDFIINWKHVKILNHLYHKCENGRFTGMAELSKSLGMNHSVLLDNIRLLAEHDFFNIIYSTNPDEYAKTFTLHGKEKLYEKLKSYIRQVEESLITIYNITGRESVLDLVKF